MSVWVELKKILDMTELVENYIKSTKPKTPLHNGGETRN